MVIVFDTETTGVFGKRMTDLDPAAPHVASLAVVAYTDDLESEVFSCYKLIKPEGWVMPEEASAVNGLTQEQLERDGVPLAQVIAEVRPYFAEAAIHAGFNVRFDERMLHVSCLRIRQPDLVVKARTQCLMLAMAEVIAEPTPWGDMKWPKLSHAFRYCYRTDFEGAHDALADVRATRDVWAMCRYEGWVKF